MNAEIPPAADAGRASEPSPQRHRRRDTLAAVGIAVVIAAFGGGAIYAATGHTQNIGSGFPPGGPGFGPGGPGGPGSGGPGSGGPGSSPGGPGAAGTDGPALHGAFVVADSDAQGRYVTVLAQTGTVTAASPTSLTVRSEDGFTQSYTTTRDQPVMRVDDAVTVRATQPAPDVTPTVTELLEPPAGTTGR